MNPVYVLETIPLQAKELHQVNLLTYERMGNQRFVDYFSPIPDTPL